MNHSDINNLLDRYLAGQCTAEEERRVEQWLDQEGIAVNEWTLLDGEGKQKYLSGLYTDIQRSIHRKAPVVAIDHRRGWKWMAAAAVLVFLVCGLWFLVGRNRGEKPSIAVSSKVQQDVAPGREGAILTLADGRQIVLDSVTNGSLAKQGAVDVTKQGNQLVYDQSGKVAEVVYNTMSTPKGRQYSLVLSDGSKVWLNAASSIRFPTAFSGNSRVVEITGEAYFEVAHNPSKPFKVGIPLSGGNEGGMQVEVLGTHFNINAYSDEPIVKTTLLEGKVRVTKGREAVIIKPGDQAQAGNVTLSPGERAPLEGGKGGASPLTIDHSPDLEAVMAWKNGLFQMNNADIATIMRQISRWYDMDVVYEKGIPEGHITGKVPRNTNLSNVLKVLEYSGLRFQVEGKKITVK